jgi:RimJ/RimL family protein N-acetyltransferase
MLGPTLETERLILRPPAREEFHDWAAMLGDDRVGRFLGGTLTRPEAWGRLAGSAGSWTLLGFGMFSVIEKASGRWIGRIGPIRPEGWPGPEVGWGLAPDFWGRGYATEAAATAMDWAVEHLGWTDIIHCIDPANTPSQRVARRLGSTIRGPGRLPPPFEEAPIDIWGQTAAQWRARRHGFAG